MICGLLILVCFKIGNRVKRVEIWYDSVERVRILPDTIKVNGDSLSFRGKSDGRIFKSIINSSPRGGERSFQALTDLHEIELEGSWLSSQKGREILVVLNYQAYLKTPGNFPDSQYQQKSVTSKGWQLGYSENPSSLRGKAVVWIKAFSRPYAQLHDGAFIRTSGHRF